MILIIVVVIIIIIIIIINSPVTKPVEAYARHAPLLSTGNVSSVSDAKGRTSVATSRNHFH